LHLLYRRFACEGRQWGRVLVRDRTYSDQVITFAAGRSTSSEWCLTSDTPVIVNTVTARDLRNNCAGTVLDDAATLAPPLLHTLDAIHLAAAQRAGSSLRAVVTYDGRMVEAAAALGMPHVSPA
jgi:hypothetical protein